MRTRLFLPSPPPAPLPPIHSPRSRPAPHSSSRPAAAQVAPITTGLSDRHPYVRRTAVMGVLKVYHIDPNTVAQQGAAGAAEVARLESGGWGAGAGGWGVHALGSTLDLEAGVRVEGGRPQHQQQRGHVQPCGTAAKAQGGCVLRE